MSGKFYLGKRTNSDDTSAAGSSSKKSRYDPDAQIVPNFDESAKETTQKDVNIPKVKYGTEVERHLARRAGEYVLGHEIGHNPAVPVNQFLARKDGTDQYYVLKILTYDQFTESPALNKEVLQGKTLLHTEYSLLTLLADLPGVIHHHGIFSDFAMEEKVVEKPDRTKTSIYTGKIKRRIILVLDCLVVHEFDAKSSAYVNLQKYISSNKFTELEAMIVFCEIVSVVEKLHSRNIIHRDLKLNNFVFNVRTKQVTVTNFFLGKHLNREDDNLYDQRGSPAYISPDVLGGKPYKGKPSDIWALGVVLYTMIFGKFPFVDTTPTALFKKIRQADYVIPTDIRVCEVTVHLIRSMLTLNPQERLTATEVRIEVQKIIKQMRGPKIDFDQVVPVSLEDDPYGLQIPKPPAFIYKCPRYDPSRDLITNTLRTNTQKAVNESFLKPRVLSIQRVGSDLRPIASLARNALINNNVLSWNLGRNRNLAQGNRNRSQSAPQNRQELVDIRIAPTNDDNSSNRPNSEQQILLRVNPRSIQHIIQNNALNSVQNPAINELYSSLSEMFARGQIRSPDPETDREFQGIVTNEIANSLVAMLLHHFRNNEIVREILRNSSGNRVNGVLELLRRFGVQMETSLGQIQIKKEQTLDLLLFLTYLLQIAGYKNNYFLNIE